MHRNWASGSPGLHAVPLSGTPLSQVAGGGPPWQRFTEQLWPAEQAWRVHCWFDGALGLVQTNCASGSPGLHAVPLSGTLLSHVVGGGGPPAPNAWVRSVCSAYRVAIEKSRPEPSSLPVQRYGVIARILVLWPAFQVRISWYIAWK